MHIHAYVENSNAVAAVMHGGHFHKNSSACFHNNSRVSTSTITPRVSTSTISPSHDQGKYKHTCIHVYDEQSTKRLRNSIKSNQIHVVGSCVSKIRFSHNSPRMPVIIRLALCSPTNQNSCSYHRGTDMHYLCAYNTQYAGACSATDCL